MSSVNKIALVTGGSRGLGKDMALSLAKKGIDVIITYNTRKEDAQEVVTALQQAGRKAAALQLNTADIKSFDTFFKQLSEVLKGTFRKDRFDFLVNNAGIGIHALFTETTEEQFDQLMNVHLKGTVFLTQKALPLLADEGGIVNISTGLARFSVPGYSAYASMKGAIETMTRYQAKELGSRKIRVNAVAPGAIETDFGGGRLKTDADIRAFVTSATAMGRTGKPDDIGGVVAFLCTDDARWITAQRIEVSGGMNL